MAVIIDEVTATVESAPPPASATSTGANQNAGREIDPVEVVRMMKRLAERAARLNAD